MVQKANIMIYANAFFAGNADQVLQGFFAQRGMGAKGNHEIQSGRTALTSDLLDHRAKEHGQGEGACVIWD
jgi:hypothetical protein